jgi:hypothetical protein
MAQTTALDSLAGNGPAVDLTTARGTMAAGLYLVHLLLEEAWVLRR